MVYTLPLSLPLSSVSSSLHFKIPSLLQFVDHVYQISGSMPLRYHEGSERWRGVEIERDADAFCVAQSVRCRPFEGSEYRNHLGRYLIRETCKNKPPPFECSVSVVGVGGSSLKLSSVVRTAEGRTEGRTEGVRVLATVERTFVRVGGDGRPLNFTEDQRSVLSRLEREHYDQKVVPSPHSPLPFSLPSPSPPTATVVGRSLLNFAGHVDHAALAGVALDALDAEMGTTEPTAFDVRYVSQAALRDVLSTAVSEILPESGSLEEGSREEGEARGWEIRKGEGGEVVARGTAGGFVEPAFEVEKL